MKTLRALPLALLLATTPALADVVPPDVDACNGRAVGAACGGTMGVPAGTCRNATCTRLDYAGWNRDAMAMPPTMQYPCVRCEGGATDAGPADAGATTPPATSSNSGCAVGGSLGRRVGPWALAGLAWVVLLGRRRRA